MLLDFSIILPLFTIFVCPPQYYVFRFVDKSKRKPRLEFLVMLFIQSELIHINEHKRKHEHEHEHPFALTFSRNPFSCSLNNSIYSWKLWFASMPETRPEDRSDLLIKYGRGI